MSDRGAVEYAGDACADHAQPPVTRTIAPPRSEGGLRRVPGRPGGDELVDGVLDAGGAEGLRLADLGRADG
jgi:hypothetical protein